MTFTYDATSISTDLAKVRMLIRDTDASKPLFTDEEITAILVMDADLYMAASLACRAVATDKSKTAMVVQMPGTNITAQEVYKAFSAQADHWERLAKEGAVPATANVYEDTQTWLDAITGRHDIEFELPTGSD